MFDSLNEEMFVRAGQCAGCAFAAGSPANQSPLTLIKARICVLTKEPFYCHANLRVDGTLIPGTGPMVLCRGFVDAMQARIDHHVEDLPEWKQDVYAVIGDAIAEIERHPGMTEERAMDLFREMLQRTTRELEQKHESTL